MRRIRVALNLVLCVLCLTLFNAQFVIATDNQVATTPVANVEHKFVVTAQTTNLQIKQVQQILESQKGDLAIFGPLFPKMSNEIAAAIGLPNAEIRHLTWNLSIKERLGSLQVFAVRAVIDKTSVAIFGKSVLYSMPVPSFFTHERKCARTGQRRYIIAGPRREECNFVTVPRSPTTAETEDITNKLIRHAETKRLDLN